MNASVITSEVQIQLNVNQYLSLISFTILLHEYCITFASEIERFWKHESGTPTWASLFFYINRYLTLFGHMPIAVEDFWTASVSAAKLDTCNTLQSYHQYFSVIVQIMVAILLIMRMYALYNRSRRVLALFVGVALAAIAFGCWAILSSRRLTANEPQDDLVIPIGCPSGLSHPVAVRLGAAWTGMLIFDALVFFMTLYKSLTLSRVKGMELLSLMLRDGSIYFGVMVASNLANILTFLFGQMYIRGVATIFTNIISSIMISRLMLNIRDPSLTSSGTTTGAKHRHGGTSLGLSTGASIFATTTTTSGSGTLAYPPPIHFGAFGGASECDAGCGCQGADGHQLDT